MNPRILILALLLASCGPDDLTETQAALADEPSKEDKRGPKGDKGDPGKDGKDAESCTLGGTEEEPLVICGETELKLPKGDKGDKGDPGDPGADGESIVGPMGPTGSPGAGGAPGATGAAGADGEDAVRQWLEHPDGTYIGDIVGVDGTDYFVRREITGGAIARFKLTQSAGVLFTYSMNGPTFYFAGAGCTGAVFTARSQIGWLNTTRTPNGTMYIAHGPTVTETRSWQSVANVSGDCAAIANSSAGDWVDAETWTLPLASQRAEIKP